MSELKTICLDGTCATNTEYSGTGIVSVSNGTISVDAYSMSETDSLLASKASASDVYTKAEIDSNLDNVLHAAITQGGDNYGIEGEAPPSSFLWGLYEESTGMRWSNGDSGIDTHLASTTYVDNAVSGKADAADVPVITMQTTDPGEGQPLAANHFIAVYDGTETVLDAGQSQTSITMSDYPDNVMALLNTYTSASGMGQFTLQDGDSVKITVTNLVINNETIGTVTGTKAYSTSSPEMVAESGPYRCSAVTGGEILIAANSDSTPPNPVSELRIELWTSGTFANGSYTISYDSVKIEVTR